METCRHHPDGRQPEFSGTRFERQQVWVARHRHATTVHPMANNLPNQASRKRLRASRNDAAIARNERLYNDWQDAEDRLATTQSALEDARTRADVTDETLETLSKEVQHATEMVDRAKATLWEKNLPLLGRFLYKYRARRASENRELESLARTALWQAINTWDPEKGSLAGWAYFHVHAAATDFLRDERFPSLSDRAFEARPKIVRAIEQMEDDNEPVTIHTVADKTDISPVLVEQVMTRPTHISMDQKVLRGDESSATVAEFVEDDTLDGAAPSSARLSMSIDQLREATEDLDAVSLFTVLRRNGLDSGQPWRITEVAVALGLGRGAVNRLEKNAMRTDTRLAAAHGYLLLRPCTDADGHDDVELVKTGADTSGAKLVKADKLTKFVHKHIEQRTDQSDRDYERTMEAKLQQLARQIRRQVEQDGTADLMLLAER